MLLNWEVVVEQGAVGAGERHDAVQRRSGERLGEGVPFIVVQVLRVSKKRIDDQIIGPADRKELQTSSSQ
jgi:hypothetical protein